MDFRILGPLEVLDEDRAVMPAGSKQRALLALLLVHANETLTTDRLIDELWGAHPPARAAKTVQMHVSRLRKTLGADGGLVVTREGGYELRLKPEQLDSLQFERLSAEGSGELAAGRPEAAVEVLERALSLWRDVPLADLAYEPFAQSQIPRLEDMRVATLEQLIEAKLLLGREDDVIVQLEKLVAEHPYRERMRAQLMLALYRCERQADALQAYQDARERLVQDLGIEPGERLRELERQILAQDPALSAPEGRAEGDGSAPGELPTGVVTFMLTDIEGSAGLWEADPEGMAAALELHDELIARTVNAHAGRLLKTKGEGDATMAAFRRASDAVAGAVALQEALGAAPWPGGLELRVRIALHTGEAQERAGDYFGPVLNRAARLRSLREGGVTVVSQATAELVRDRLPEEVELVDLDRRALRGLSRSENVFELRPVSQSPVRAPRETRKTVTVVVSSVVVLARGRELDIEARERLLARYFREMRTVLERHGGTIDAYPGDALMAVFGVPLLHEDDAIRAVRAAAELARVIPALGDDPGGNAGIEATMRVGVGTGEVIAARPAAGQPLATGAAVNFAKFLEGMAGPNEIFIDEETHRLVRGSVRAESSTRQGPRGDDRLAAFRVLEVLLDTSGRAPRLDSPLVGRGRQLATLSSVFAAAVADRACHLVTVLGPAGVGKSRLVSEFVAGLGDQVRVLRGRCPPYGEGITYWPLAEIVGDLTSAQGSAEPSVPAIAAYVAGEPKADLIVAGIAEALGLGGSGGGTSEQIFRAVRRLFEALARRRPLVVVFDDLQWAEPTFLDLVDHVTDLARDAPIVVLCSARPEMLDARFGWGGGKLNATSIHLEPLDQDERWQLISNLLSRATIPPETAAQIADVTEGNPLFAEELVFMLIDEGLLRHEDGHWTVADELSELPVPPTIHALLAARLERLPQDERALLAHASVEGVVFHRAALDEVTQTTQEAVIERNLTSLIRRDVICPDRALFPEDDAFRFRHVLIRDAAYRSLLKETRAELHARVAAWLERTAGPRLGEFEEIVGYHLEQAHRSLVELSPPTEQTRTLAARAAKLFSSAGKRAGARGDVPAAETLLGRAESLLPDGEDKRDVQLERAFVIAERGAEGDAARAEAIVADVASAPDARADTRVTAAVVDAYLGLAIGLHKSTEKVRAAAQQAIPTLTKIGNHAWLSKAHSYMAFVDSTAGHWRKATDSLEKALYHARQAGVAKEETEVLWFLTGALHYGPMPVEEGIEWLRTMLDPSGEQPPARQRLSDWQRELVEATGLAGLEAMRDNAGEARIRADRAKVICEELGQLNLALADQVSGWVALLTGDLTTAEADLVKSFEILESMGEIGYLSTTAALLAEAQYRQGRLDEALDSTENAKRLAVPDDIITQVLWRTTCGKVIARRGHVEGGRRLIRKAISTAADTDNLNLRGDSYFALAEVLRDDRRCDEALAAISEAIGLYAEKGNLASEREAIRFRARVQSS